MPGRKVRIRSILDKADDLERQLLELPLIHVTGGRLVLDVQRPDRQTVQFSSVIEQIPVPGAGRQGSRRFLFRRKSSVGRPGLAE